MGGLKFCSDCKHWDVLIWDEPCRSCFPHNDNPNWISNKEEDKMSTFKVGDLITGIEGNCYGVTNSNAICKVIETYGDDKIRVELVETTDEKWMHREGEVYTVSMRYFKLVEPKSKFKVGDLITVTAYNNYGYTNSDSICEVIRVYPKDDYGVDMDVKLKSTVCEYSTDVIGVTFDVDSSKFQLVEPKPSIKSLEVCKDILNLVFINFPTSSTSYLFKVPKHITLTKDELVVCDTVDGERVGEVIGGSFTLTEEIYDTMIKKIGLTPNKMKFITGRVDKVMF